VHQFIQKNQENQERVTHPDQLTIIPVTVLVGGQTRARISISTSTTTEVNCEKRKQSTTEEGANPMNRISRTLMTAALSLIISAIAAHARLGWTLDKCRDFYGSDNGEETAATKDEIEDQQASRIGPLFI
jgi:hypothetical protein